MDLCSINLMLYSDRKKSETLNISILYRLNKFLNYEFPICPTLIHYYNRWMNINLIYSVSDFPYALY